MPTLQKFRLQLLSGDTNSELAEHGKSWNPMGEDGKPSEYEKLTAEDKRDEISRQVYSI